ncbi:Peroxin-3 [Lineolata rhizophorae]|uniref:Peroxin-3 n=1 Tax=Lineolata rhizophorae TaxID=578093 RepID=A0A6A6NZL8_9PEZI|nr:Peroxin-3 [Lineolata rhizophorae]
MLDAPRRWFRRNRTNFAIGAGVIGGAYLAGQYVLGKISEARQRLSDDRIARDNLRRRFEQNQEDCTYTVLAILPTASENILNELPVERTLAELQRQRAERLARSGNVSVASSDVAPSITTTEDDTARSEGFVHASQQIANGEGKSESAENGNGSGSGEGESTIKATKKTKAQLWSELKINSITRAFTLLYTLSLLTLLTRIQLNLLGRRSYLASVVSLASPPPPGGPNSSAAGATRIELENRDDDAALQDTYCSDFDTNRKYLSFSWWLLHRGCRDIMERVKEAVETVFGGLNPREEVTLERIGELVLEVRRRVEGKDVGERRNMKWLPFLLPPTDQESYVLRESGMTTSSSPPPTPSPDNAPNVDVPPALRRLLNETSDLIDSPNFTHVLTRLLDACFGHLIDIKLAQLVYKSTSSDALSGSTPASSISPQTPQVRASRTRLADVLPVFTRQAHVIGAAGDTDVVRNEYIDVLDEVGELRAFAAVVYSSNWEIEGEGGSGDTWKEDDLSRPGTAGTDAEGPGTTPVGGEESSLFESAWGKATASSFG